MRGFTIPIYKYQSTTGARRAYEKAFAREWPYDDEYLRELAALVPNKAESLVLKTTRCTEMLLRMREQDTEPKK